MMAYRVREATVEVCNGFRCWKARLFLCERQISIGPFRWWWPALGAEWRNSKEIAMGDMYGDKRLREPERTYYLDGRKGGE